MSYKYLYITKAGTMPAVRSAARMRLTPNKGLAAQAAPGCAVGDAQEELVEHAGRMPKKRAAVPRYTPRKTCPGPGQTPVLAAHKFKLNLLR